MIKKEAVMVLDKKQTTVAYRCPKCGAGVMSVVGLFDLASALVKLKCDCGGSEMSVVYGKDRKVRFTVPCILCPNPHTYTLSSTVFFDKELFVLPCHYSGINIAMMGEANSVKAELARTELELLDMLEKSGIDSFEDIRSDDDVADPQVLEIISYVIRELDEEGRIYCRCDVKDEGDYELEPSGESLTVRCRRCGAKKEIFARSHIQAHEFLNADTLTLE